MPNKGTFYMPYELVLVNHPKQLDLFSNAFLHASKLCNFTPIYLYSFQLTKCSVLILQVVGVPVTLNGDLKNQFVETNVGFDTICKVLIKRYLAVNILRNLS